MCSQKLNMNQKGPLTTRSFEFSVDIIRLFQHHTKIHKEFILGKQMLRSGTAIGALVREANHAESKRDFVHKLGIALKECDETLYWLELLVVTKYLEQDQYDRMQDKCTTILKILKRSILTAKSNL